jgi:ubiquinone/menaquinone biosynthesis C-methylase UbiE
MGPARAAMDPTRDVIDYYERFPEESRLSLGESQLEFERTKEILRRFLPQPPARIVDVGGAAGAYSMWLAALAYEVHLVDLSERLVGEARKASAMRPKPIASMTVADARRLPQADAFADAVLLMGPLYHLTDAVERQAALAEARRVLKAGGRLVAAAISRYASALDGLARRRATDPAFVRIRDRDLRDGQHRNDTGQLAYFTTAYLHRPEDLHQELLAAGFDDVHVLGVEGAGWLFADFGDRWTDPVLRDDLLATARALESEPSMVGISAHLIGVGRKPA